MCCSRVRPVPALVPRVLNNIGRFSTLGSFRLFAALFLIFVAGCSRSAPSPQRLALLPFENLSPDDSLSWLSHAVPRALGAQLTGIGGIQPALVEAPRDAAAVRATQVLYGYLTRQGGSLRLTAHLQDASRSKTLEVIQVNGPVSAGPLPLIESIARRLNAHARPPITRSAEAFRSYEQALQSSDRTAAEESFEAALKADPGFGAAWVAWAQQTLARGDAAAARAIISRSRQAQLDSAERARLDLLDSTIAGDTSARLKALAEVTRANPQDAASLAALADAQLLDRRFAEAVASLRKAVEIQPENRAFWNSLGYAQAYAGDLDGAIRSLQEYQRLAPNEANPLDSMGEVSYHHGRFAEAEKFFLQTHEKDRNFMGGAALAKAAWTRLMRKDVRGARALFDKFIELRRAAKDPTVEFRLAQVEYLTNQPKEAAARLEKLASVQQPELVALARSQLAVWALEQGNRDAARAHATAAANASGNPGLRNLAALCLFLAQPQATAAEWTTRAERAIPAPAQALARSNALAYALLLDRHFNEAIRPLSDVYQKTPPASDSQVRVLLAWAQLESGHKQEAKDLLRIWPLPQGTAEPALLWLTYPRILDLMEKVR